MTSLSKSSEAGQVVAIARELAIPEHYYAFWAVFAPFENNYISWNTTSVSYSVFASLFPLSNGAVITANAWRAAEPGLAYPLYEGTFRTGHPVDWVSETEIGIMNNSTDFLAFGLAQDVSINSEWFPRALLSATDFLGYEHGEFPLVDSLYVFVVSNSMVAGTVTTDLYALAATDPTLIPYSSANNQRTAVWDRGQGRFISY